MVFTQLHYLGFLATLVLIAGAGLYSGRFVKNESDFSSGGSNASAVMVTGTFIGTIVGGAATIGTAQMAFLYGFSSLWFTFGSAMAILIMALTMAKPLRRSGHLTLQGVITDEFGLKTGILSSVLGTLGIVINVISQIIASSALLLTIFNLKPHTAAIITVALMSVYVLLGGVIGTSLVGAIKSVLLYFTIIAITLVVVLYDGGIQTITSTLDPQQYYHFFARGFGIDFGGILSVIVGVVSTQTYAQAFLIAKDDKTAMRGAYYTALLIPPIGVASMLVGLKMKAMVPDMLPVQVFPVFLMNNLHPVLAGVSLATLLISTLGTGAGLALGGSSVISYSLMKKTPSLMQSRLILFLILIVSGLFSFGALGGVILEWSSLSLALRGSVVLFPLLAALFLPGRIKPFFVNLGIIISPVIIVFAKLFWTLSFDPLFIGLAFNLLMLVMGYEKRHMRSKNE